MSSVTNSVEAAATAAVLALPRAQRVVVMKSLVEAMVNDLADTEGLAKSRLEELAVERAALVDSSPVLAQMARAADTALFALCARHHEVVRRFDLARRESDPEGGSHRSSPGEHACDDLAPRLGRTSARVERMAADAEHLQTEDPELWAACAAGDSVVASCRVVHEELAHLCADDRDHALRAVIDANIHHSWPNTVRWRTRRLLAKLELARPRGTAAEAERVELRFEENAEHSGLTDLHVTLEAGRAWRVRAAIEARARELMRACDADREQDNAESVYPRRLARVDAFVELLLENTSVRADVTLSVPVGTDGRVAARDVHVPGVGTLHGETVDALVASVDPRVRVALTDGGAAVWSTTESYRPTAGIRRLVIERDEHCRFPGCTRPSSVCDLDHVVPRAAGGPTMAANLQLLCRHHHRAKTHGGWRVAIEPDGTCRWHAPTGVSYTTRPADAGMPVTPGVSPAA